MNTTLLEQVIDLRNRITDLASKGGLVDLTNSDVALLSYVLGHFHGLLATADQRPEPLGDLNFIERPTKTACF